MTTQPRHGSLDWPGAPYGPAAQVQPARAERRTPTAQKAGGWWWLKLYGVIVAAILTSVAIIVATVLLLIGWSINQAEDDLQDLQDSLSGADQSAGALGLSAECQAAVNGFGLAAPQMRECAADDPQAVQSALAAR